MPELSSLPEFHFDNTYADQLEGFYVSQLPAEVSAPELLYFNEALAQDLGLIHNTNDEKAYTLSNTDKAFLAQVFTGQELPTGANPIAQAYAGHQFGHFNPQLGDGRALIIGEVLNPKQQRYDIALKGSGRTPFSRGGDGKAGVGPMLRETLISEALHGLGIPSTRALAVAGTGDPVYRETVLPGAILTRVAASHIRVGTFEYFACRSEHQRLQQLADYCIARHDPELANADNPYLAFFQSVIKRQAKLIAQWMSMGFIHGVMNTDNMTICGETIDYGPCAFMEAYDPDTVFSSIDHHHRYAYGNQPRIAQWNLSRLGQSLLPLIDQKDSVAIKQASDILDTFVEEYQQAWLDIMIGKLGLTPTENKLDDKPLIESWLRLLEIQQTDYTLTWRRLADAAEGNTQPLQDLFIEHSSLDSWLQQWQTRWSNDANNTKNNDINSEERAKAMRTKNPWIIARNHQVEAALDAASNDNNLQPFEQLMAALQDPFTEKPDYQSLAEPAPMEFTERYQTFCGT